MVTDGLNRSFFGMPVDFYHVDYLGLSPLAYHHASQPVLSDYKTHQALYTMSNQVNAYHNTAVS